MVWQIGDASSLSAVSYVLNLLMLSLPFPPVNPIPFPLLTGIQWYNPWTIFWIYICTQVNFSSFWPQKSTLWWPRFYASSKSLSHKLSFLCRFKPTPVISVVGLFDDIKNIRRTCKCRISCIVQSSNSGAPDKRKSLINMTSINFNH